MRVPGEQRREVEQRIRAAAAGLLAGNIPPGGHCDITTLARQAGVSRATLYRGYPRLKQQFEQQIAQAAAGGQHPDPRDAQIAALKARNDRLQERLDISQRTTSCGSPPASGTPTSPSSSPASWATSTSPTSAWSPQPCSAPTAVAPAPASTPRSRARPVDLDQAFRGSGGSPRDPATGWPRCYPVVVIGW